MSRPDATASAALDARVIRPGFFVFLDIDGDPFRVNTLGFNVVVSGTPYPEMNDETFIGISGSLIDIGTLNSRAGGSDSLIAKLSGLRDVDNDTLNTIGDTSKWQGRTAMLWRMIRDENGGQQGAIQHYYTGYMTSLAIAGDPQSQTIELTIESYLAAFSEASNRTYLDQELFDPGDLSARASIAIANGNSGNPLTSNTGSGVSSSWSDGYGAGDYYRSMR